MTRYRKSWTQAIEEVILYEAIKPIDKSVIDAFYYKKERVAGNLLSTNGHSLQKHGMGGQTIAAWLKDKIAITAVSDVKSTEAILKYMKKSIPKGMFDPKSYKKFFEEVEATRMPMEAPVVLVEGETYLKGKSATGYDLYHKTFSDAMQHAYDHAKTKGFIVDPKEIDDKVATGPKKPSKGKTNRYSLKAGRKKKQEKLFLLMEIHCGKMDWVARKSHYG